MQGEILDMVGLSFTGHRAEDERQSLTPTSGILKFSRRRLVATFRHTVTSQEKWPRQARPSVSFVQIVLLLCRDRRWHGQKRLGRMPEQLPVRGQHDRVRHTGQNDQLVIAVGQLTEEILQVRNGGISVILTADHESRHHDLLGIDLRHIGCHVEVGSSWNLIAERHLGIRQGLDGNEFAGAWLVAGGDRTDHLAVTLAHVVSAIIVELLGTLDESWGAFALVRESGQHQTIDAVGGNLRKSAGADRTSGFTEKVILLPSGFLGEDVERNLEIFDTALDVGITRSPTGLAVIFVVHGPAVEAVAGELVHHGVFLTFDLNIEAARRHRRTVHEEQHRLGRLAGFRRTDALAEHPQRHITLLRPILVAPDLAFFAGSAGALSGQRSGKTSGDKTEAGALHQRAASERLVDERFIGLRHDSLSDHVFSLLSFYPAKPDFGFSSNEIAASQIVAQPSRPRTATEDIPRYQACPRDRITVTTPCLERSVYARCFKYPLSISGIVGVAVHGIDPQDVFRLLDRFDVEVDGDRFAVAAHQHAFQRFIRTGVDFLMRHIRRHKNEVAGICFRRKFQTVSPPHPCLAFDDKDDAFEMTVMMRTRLGIRLDGDCAGPQFLSADAGKINRGLAVHAGGRGHIRIKLISGNDPDPIMLPAPFALIVGMIGMGVIVRIAHVDRFRLNLLEDATKNSADKPARKERSGGPKIGSSSNRPNKENVSWVASQTRLKATRTRRWARPSKASAKPAAPTACRVKAPFRKLKVRVRRQLATPRKPQRMRSTRLLTRPTGNSDPAIASKYR